MGSLLADQRAAFSAACDQRGCLASPEELGGAQRRRRWRRSRRKRGRRRRRKRRRRIERRREVGPRLLFDSTDSVAYSTA